MIDWPCCFGACSEAAHHGRLDTRQGRNTHLWQESKEGDGFPRFLSEIPKDLV
jgi:hypothetical protein